jgi:SAM-dependent methyltransferase
MTQNIYDNEEFFAGYSLLGRSVEGLDGAAEWPALRAMLPELQEQKVLDLGCGFGWFCRWAREQGAAEVLGIDVSQRMLERATANTQDAAIAYRLADMEQLELPPCSYDLVYSSLALHYIADLDRLLSQVRRSLRAGGRLVCSVEHAIYTAPSNPRWLVDGAGHKTWPIDSYQCEGPRSTDWLTRGVIKYHRTVATYINALLRLGFTLRRVEEWGPTDEQVASRPALAEERQRPMFLLMSASR